MNFWQLLTQGLAFLTNLIAQLAAFNSTPVGGEATISITPGHLLEVSEGGEHWEIKSVTAVRVK